MSRLVPVRVCPRHRGILAAVGAVAVVAVGGCSIVSPSQEGQPAAPALVGSASADGAPATPASRPASASPLTTSPAASVGSADVAADPVAAVSAVAGSWTGTILEPPTAIDPLSQVAYQTDRPVTFDATVTLRACTVGAACGTLEQRTAVWPPTGRPFACAFDLTFRGFYRGSTALAFAAAPIASQSRDCAPVEIVVTPLTSGDAVAVEEAVADGGTFDHGLLTRPQAP
jgi:hypothetical protein